MKNKDITYCTNKGCPLRSQCLRNDASLKTGIYSLTKFEYDFIHNIIVCENFIEAKKDAK